MKRSWSRLGGDVIVPIKGTCLLPSLIMTDRAQEQYRIKSIGCGKWHRYYDRFYASNIVEQLIYYSGEITF